MSLPQTLQQALAYHQAGCLPQAAALYRAILQAQPTHAEANYHLGMLLGQVIIALPYLKAALDADPAQEHYWCAYAETLLASGQAKTAHNLLQKAEQNGFKSPAIQALRQQAKAAAQAPTAEETSQLLALFNAGQIEQTENRARWLVERYPISGFVWKVLGAAMARQGKECLSVLKKATELSPDDANAHSNLGAVLRGLGQFDGALVSTRRALEIQPNFAEAHNNLGNILRDLGQLDGALASTRRALEIQPNFADAHNNLGSLLHDIRQFDAAVTSCRRALEIQPNFAEAHSNLGSILNSLGQYDEALASCRRALEVKPDFAAAYNNLGMALQALGQFDSAVGSYRRALEIQPDFADAHNNLGAALRDLRQFDGALASARRALEIKPDLAEAHSNLGSILNSLGQLDGALASFRRALEIKPDFVDAHSNLLFTLSRHASVDAPTLFAEHTRFAEMFEAPLRADWPQHTNGRDPARCLQVGFVSSDLKNHALASFIEPVLAHLATCPALALHAYANHPRDDSLSLRLRAYFKHWHAIAGLPDSTLAQKIIDDKIDVLIDLSGHTAQHRLLAFARKPAPLQASWFGYIGTTGLQAMDYYFTDRHFLPPGKFDHQFSEKLVYLPATATFFPFEGSPPVNALPAARQAYLTFGSFNVMNKLSPSVIALWSRLLRALPDAKMLLGGMGDAQPDQLSAWFAAEGIDHERLSFYPRTDLFNYLTLHHQVDFCLDTFPFNGGVTTLQALWMGVPTLTLAGSSAAGRWGCAIAGHVGLEAWVAATPDDFVEKGLFWANHLAALAALRATLRDRFAQSALGQPTAVAAGLERALRHMWQRWCADLPAESFAADLTYVDTLSRGTQQDDGEAP